MKKFLAVLLSILLLVSSLAGCSKAPKGDETLKNEPGSETTPTSSVSETAGDTETDTLEPVTLKWYLHGSNVTDDKEVLAKANEYLKEKINVTLEPIWGTWGDFDNNSVLAINGGDDVDIYFTSSWSADEYNAFAKKGAWVRLDDPENNLLEKYAPDVWALLPDVLKQGATIEGADGVGVYAIPGYKDIATQNTWDVNVTLLEKYGYTVDDIKNADYYTFGDILKKVKEGEGADFYPLLVEGNVLERMVDNSTILAGDSGTNNLLSYYINPTDPSADGIYGNKIISKFESPEYKKFVEKTREYYLAGYIDPAMSNANQANDTRSAKQLTGDYLIGTQSYAYGYETQVSKERGIKVAMVPATPPYVDSTSSQGALMAISTASKNPERALMFLNLLNTDKYLMTLLDFGIEGVHYNLNDQGEAVFTDKRKDYIPWTNGMGNVTLLPPQEGQGSDFIEKFKEFYAGSKMVPYIGFTFNPANVETELAALSNVAAEYALALNTGSIDPAEKLPEFIKKLKDNGIDAVVAEANTQLEAFMAKK